MKKILLVTICLSAFAFCFSQDQNNGQRGIFESYVILSINSGSNTFYDMQANTANPDFNGANLGTFGCSQSLVVKGGQNKTYKNNGCNITNGDLFYRVYSGTGAGSGGFPQINLPFAENLGGGGDQRWQSEAGTVNLISGLLPGTYTLEVYSRAQFNSCGFGDLFSNNNGANYKATFTVGPAPTAAITNNSATTVLTCTQTAISVTATGGASYSWDNGLGTGASKSITSPGTYNVMVTGANGCTSSVQIGITQNIVAPTVTASNVTGCSNSPISLIGSPNGGTFSTANPYSGPSTTYTYMYTDPTNGCSTTSLAANITVNPSPTLNTVTATPACVNTPSLVTMTGLLPSTLGSITYTLSFTGLTVYNSSANSDANGVFSFSTPPLPSSANGGTVTITSATATGTGCTTMFSGKTANIVVTTVNVAIATQTNIACHGGANGSATVTATGGTVPYTYSWSPTGGTGATATGLTAGEYTVMVTDANGCQKTAIVNITQPTAPLSASVQVNSNVTTFGGNDGSATAIVSGGTAPYSPYGWSTGGQTATISGLQAATYCLNQVIDANGCALNNSMFPSCLISFSITQPIRYYQDLDEDGFGNPAVFLDASSPPSGYVSNNTDCNDNNPAINPLATEICWNNIDDNCTNTKSEGCAAIPVLINNPVTITNFSTHLSAVQYTYPGATSLDYRYEVTNISVTPNQTRTFTQTGVFARYFTIPVDIRGFNTTYSIRASAVINGEEVPYAVPVITVISTGIPTVKLAPTSCGTELSRLNATISASPGFNATLYKFRIRLTSDNDTMPTYYYFESPSRFIGANSFVGLSLQYNTSYSVSVQYTTASVGAAVTAITAEYGEECIITTPRIPVIGLSTPTCGTTLDRLGATISATPATYAVQYQFRVRLTSDNGPTPTYYFTIPSASRFSSLTAAQGLVVANGTQYSVSVRYSIPVAGGGTEFSDYDSSECIVQTPSAAVPRTLKASFSVVAYPNPFSEGFQLDVKTENAGIVSIKTYDMIGRLIEERSSKVNTLESLTIGSNYPSGVYNVIVSQEDELRTVRVVKR